MFRSFTWNLHNCTRTLKFWQMQLKWIISQKSSGMHRKWCTPRGLQKYTRNIVTFPEFLRRHSFMLKTASHSRVIFHHCFHTSSAGEQDTLCWMLGFLPKRIISDFTHAQLQYLHNHDTESSQIDRCYANLAHGHFDVWKRLSRMNLPPPDNTGPRLSRQQLALKRIC